MQWNDDLTDLKNELSNLYPTKDDSYSLVRDAGLRSGSIAFKDKAANNWSEIIGHHPDNCVKTSLSKEGHFR
jgi:hypothetical protein